MFFHLGSTDDNTQANGKSLAYGNRRYTVNFNQSVTVYITRGSAFLCSGWLIYRCMHEESDANIIRSLEDG